jgi:hypothetical protein
MTKYVFLFVRQDISLAQQLVQTNHATFEMAYTLPQSVDDVTPSIVLVGVPSKKSLEKVIRKLKDYSIGHSAFYESDGDVGLTAVATMPLAQEQRAVLQNYKLWKEETSLPSSSTVERQPREGMEMQVPTPASGARYAGSSEKEHQPFRLEVGGSSPSPRTKLLM